MADEHLLAAELLTPEAALLSEAAVSVVLRTSDGDLTVLAGHTPLVGDVVPGVVRVTGADGTTEAFCSHGGFLQVATDRGAAEGIVDGSGPEDRSTRVTVMCGVAERVSDIDVPRAHTARDRATQAISSLSGRDDDDARRERAHAERALARAELRLDAASTGAHAG